MINAAASDREGYAEFHAGFYENVGTGSLLTPARMKGMKSPVRYTKPRPVPTILVAQLLAYIPPNATIEVLKVDAQGADAHIVRAIPLQALRRVKCVVGEFATWGYAPRGR
eukprot:gene23760-23483_t